MIRLPQFAGREAGARNQCAGDAEAHEKLAAID